jgi:hypothetical protein
MIAVGQLLRLTILGIKKKRKMTLTKKIIKNCVGKNCVNYSLNISSLKALCIVAKG